MNGFEIKFPKINVYTQTISQTILHTCIACLIVYTVSHVELQLISDNSIIL